MYPPTQPLRNLSDKPQDTAGMERKSRQAYFFSTLIERVTVKVLKYEQHLFPMVAARDATHGAIGRRQEKGFIVSAPVVVASHAKCNCKAGQEKRRGLRQERRPPRWERAKPRMVDRHSARISGRRSEDRRSHGRTNVGIEPDIGSVKSAERKISEEQQESYRRHGWCEPPMVGTRVACEALAFPRDLDGLHSLRFNQTPF